MDLYKDIISEMQTQGYEVDFIPEGKYLQDPNNIRGYKGLKRILFVHPQKFDFFLQKKWENVLAEEKFSKVYDVLFVLDGQSIHPCVFEILKKRNPELYAVNYLFDTTSGVYRFDVNFKYFNRIFSFDNTDVQKFGLNFLPIYWAPQKKEKKELDVFGLGRYSEERHKLFSELKSICEKNKLTYMLKLGTDKRDFSFMACLKWVICKLIGKTKGRISPQFKDSPLNTFENISPKEFRLLIARSEIVVDTSAPHQDGLTARFMWALGLRKKIITTNQSVEKYDFYSPEQIFIVKKELEQSESFFKFLDSSYEMPLSVQEKVNRYMLSNWLRFVLDPMYDQAC